MQVSRFFAFLRGIFHETSPCRPSCRHWTFISSLVVEMPLKSNITPIDHCATNDLFTLCHVNSFLKYANHGILSMSCVNTASLIRGGRLGKDKGNLYCVEFSPCDCSKRYTLHPLAYLFILSQPSATLQLLRKDVICN